MTSSTQSNYTKKPSRTRPELPYYRRRVQLILGHPYLFVISLLVAMVSLGTAGYMLLEGWTALDAMYMTLITMSTIGYGEVEPLSPAGRLFTVGLIVIGVIVASYAVTTTVELFTSRDFVTYVNNRRRRRALEKISDHCIICGFGRMGRSLAQELQASGSNVIAIDPDEEAIKECEQLGIPAVRGNGSDEEVLYEAGVERATSLVTSTPSDAENIFIILTAKSIKPDLKIITRSDTETSIPKLEKAGANVVISPYNLAGRRIARMLTHPNVTNFLDGVLEFGDHQMRIEEFTIHEESPLVGLSLQQAKLSVQILALDHPGEMVFTHPSADTVLSPGTAIIVMGIDHELNRLEQLTKGA